MTSSLPWIWVIEALASFNEIDTYLLINLVKRTPELSDDLDRNAREMVSLRILESLFVRKISGANDVASVPGDKIELDPSRSCEDVLHRILLEVPASELKTAALEMLKWDVRSFIMKKRSRLPKCLLQQLKGAIVKSMDPPFASLKEKSGLEFGNHYRDGVTVDSDGFNQGHEVGGVNTRCVAPTGNLDTFTQGNTSDLQEKQPGSTLVPAKRSINASTAYEIEVNETEAISENSSDPCAKAAKKFKQDVISPIQNTVPDLISSQRDGVPAESCGGSQPIVGKRNSEDDAQVGTLEASGLLKDGSAKHAASRSVLCGVDSNINNLLPQRASADKKFQNIGSSSNRCAELGTSSGSKGVLECNLPQYLRNGEPSKGDKENIEQSHESEFSSEDSLATVDCTELNLCVKCNKGGNLFVCSSDTCPLVVHESCLASVPNFDYKGNFYCPFCSYSRAISEYLEGKKKVSLARKDLNAFIGLGAGQRSKKSLPRSQGMKQHRSRGGKNEQLCRNANRRNSLNEVKEAESAPADWSSVGAQVMQTGSLTQPEASLPRNENGRNSLNEVTEAGRAPANRSSVGGQVTQAGSPTQPEASLPRNENGRNSLNEVTEAGSAPADRISIGAQVMQTSSPQPEASVREQCLVADQQPDESPLRCHRSRRNQSREEEKLCLDANRNKNSLEKAEEAGSCPVNRNIMNAEVMQMQPPQPQESSFIEESSEEDEIGSKYRVQFRNREKKYTFPLNPRLRRKKLPWTKIEEETLKEGLLRFSHFRDRWKRILDFGCDVFLEGRKAGDLKDKWRNISKATEKAT
ncbi:hypothetical protein RND71_036130 [Anisodus tanguticus]|uniref:Myb-like domain-containing protein n=1 Tax=Anisodus tanguticus TaxID=243964 RepID=A0AAE1V240_9SOLA|nr:hypothetical protein RND71_036130 [Anisodus tanguticus]